MKLKDTSNFKKGLIESIKVGGQMMIDNAEDIAGTTEYMSDLSVTITFDPEFGSIPRMLIRRAHVPSVENLNRLHDIYHGKEATDENEV